MKSHIIGFLLVTLAQIPMPIKIGTTFQNKLRPTGGGSVLKSLCVSFMGISQSLPTTGYIKMIDIWMIFTMSYPFVVITLHCLEKITVDRGTRRINVKTTGTGETFKQIETNRKLIDSFLPESVEKNTKTQ